ncbi:MAG: hypothetical protein JO227_08795 [Acetobacteraceae bacterium]|nr:hypothetical protein [Acetobacteraceae bacterium]
MSEVAFVPILSSPGPSEHIIRKIRSFNIQGRVDRFAWIEIVGIAESATVCWLIDGLVARFDARAAGSMLVWWLPNVRSPDKPFAEL